MRRIAGLIIIALALAAPAVAQEGNPCQAALTTVQPDPNQLAFHIEDIDRLGVTTLEYVIFIGESAEPQARVKVSRPELKNATVQGTTFPLCWVLTFTPPANLVRDGKTQFFVVARTEDANQRVSAWSARSNPFVLGKPPIPEPLPLPVPGVRIGRTGV